MSRGRKRNRRRNLQPYKATKGPDPTKESQASKAYTAGKTVKYKWRVAGPISPVIVSKMEDDTKS